MSGRRSGAAAPAPYPRRNTPPPLAVVRPSRASEVLWRWHDGLALLLIFVVATLLMVVAVVTVDAVDRWWVLVPVMVLDLSLTFAVIAGIAQLLADDGESLAS
jgi:hypothetical protein